MRYLKFLSKFLLLYFLINSFANAEALDIVAASGFTDSNPKQENVTKIDVKPKANDVEIALRIQRIMKATGWYTNPNVKVKEGIVFLNGKTNKREYKQWAENLAKKTQDVVAIVNQIEVVNTYSWDFDQWSTSIQKLSKGFIQNAPLYVIALFIFFITWLLTYFIGIVLRKTFHHSKIHPLLGEIIAKGTKFFIFLVGFYIILQIMGWTTIALTIAGGTGLLGIILGMAFRDIAENLLASILLSIQRPFKNGDLIAIGDITGYIERLTLRATVLITPEGSHVQIPNSTIYKSTICNFTNSPNRRECFTISLPFDTSISKAQELILSVLCDHPAILSNPEPLVLVDNLDNNTVNLGIYFWINCTKHDSRKVRSSVIRLTKSALVKERMTFLKETDSQEKKESQKIATDSEGNLNTDSKTVKNLNPVKEKKLEKNLLNN